MRNIKVVLFIAAVLSTVESQGAKLVLAPAPNWPGKVENSPEY